MATQQRLSAKRIRELLALKKIHNDYLLVGDTAGKVPYVTYRNGIAKQNVAAAWQVITPGRSTDAFEGRPQDNYQKTFVVPDARSAESRNATLQVALDWASEAYEVDPTEWIKTPFASYTVRAHLTTRLRELLPREFDPEYRDPTVQKIVKKLYGDDGDESGESMFRVVVQLYTQPEPPLYVRAVDEDAARRQLVRLFTRLAGTRILDGLKLSVYDA